jgi:hypothetical protein
VLVERLWNIVDKAPWPSTTSLTAHVPDPIPMLESLNRSIPTPQDYSLFLTGPGMRVANWRQPNHCEVWDEKRDESVVERAEQNAVQFPEFTKRLAKSIRGEESH